MIVTPAEPGDEWLAAQAAAGDDHAFEQLVSRYEARIYRLACRLTSETDAPDVLQETFLQVYPLDEFLPRFDSRGVHAGTPEELQLPSRADELLDRQALAERAREVLARLPDMYRDPFVLRDLEDLSTAEVAGLLGLDPAAVRQRVHRARLMLRGYLSDLVGVRP